MEQGIYEWMPLEKYHIGPGVSNSILTTIGTRSPMHVKYALENPKDPTDAQRLGQAFHTLALEPDEFHQRFYIFEGDLRSNAKKEEWAKQEKKGKLIVRAKQLEDVYGMVKAVKEHEDAHALLSEMGAVYERSVYWLDKETNLLCKVRPDIWIRRPDLRLVLDLKSCQGGANKDSWSWSRQIFNYSYHQQAAYYLEGCSKIEHNPYTGFGWITVESEAPYGVNVFMADKEMLEIGRAIYKKNLWIYADCVEHNMWPGYECGVKTVSLPKWSKTED